MAANDIHDPLAHAVIAALAADPAAVIELRQLIDPRDEPGKEPTPPAYTVAGLAATLHLTPKAVRNAIARGELRAVKRGGRWLVPADAVAAWTHLDPTTHPRPAAKTATPTAVRRRTLSTALERLAAP